VILGGLIAARPPRSAGHAGTRVSSLAPVVLLFLDVSRDSTRNSRGAAIALVLGLGFSRRGRDTWLPDLTRASRSSTRSARRRLRLGAEVSGRSSQLRADARRRRWRAQDEDRSILRPSTFIPTASSAR
jgi:hypothetical protein